MAGLQWNDSLCLGIETIDNEHKRLVKIANAIIKIAKEGGDKAKLVNAMRYLREYTVIHFSNEESYMKSISYPDISQHSQEHADLKRKVKEFQNILYHADTVSDHDVLCFMKSWLVEHVLGSDMKIKKFILKSTAQDDKAKELNA